ncbi:nucleoporin AMO1, partial [Drosophila navojoa]
MHAFYLFGLTLVTGAWSWGYGGPDYYGAQCDHLQCSDVKEEVCAKIEGGHQRATFDNACEAQRYSCLTGNYWRILYEGPCDCPVKCPLTCSPICATLENTQKSFQNQCEMQQFICHTSEPWRYLHEGPCAGEEAIYSPQAPLMRANPSYPLYPPQHAYGPPAYGYPAYGPYGYHQPAYGPPLPMAYPNPYISQRAASQLQPYHVYISRDALPTESSEAFGTTTAKPADEVSTELSKSETDESSSSDATSDPSPLNEEKQVLIQSLRKEINDDAIQGNTTTSSASEYNSPTEAAVSSDGAADKKAYDPYSQETTTESTESSTSDSSSDSTSEPQVQSLSRAAAVDQEI